MSLIARQSTARTIMVGPVLDSAGAAVTTAVVGDFKISKNGAAPAALNGSATLTHRHTGNYSLALTATDLDTVGGAQVTLDKTTDTCPQKDIVVVEEAVYDGFYVASAPGYVTAGNIKKGAAFAKFAFLMTDSTNHNPVTGKTVSVTISKDGGAFGALSSGDTVTEVGNGIYEVDLNATDTNANVIVLRATAAGSDDTIERIITSV